VDDLITNLERIFVKPLNDQHSQGREQRKRCIRHLAAQVFLSEVGIMAAEEQGADTTTEVVQEAESGALIPSSFSFHSSPPLDASQEQPGLPEMTEKEEAVSVRLRQYTPMKPIIAVNPMETVIISHWELGADTSQIDWNPSRPQTEDEMDFKRRKRMERARRRAEKLASRALSTDLVSTAVAASQPVPIIVASQARETMPHGQSTRTWGASSQAWGISSTQVWGVSQPMSQPMSQPVPGAFGGRPQKRVKKRSKSGFR